MLLFKWDVKPRKKVLSGFVLRIHPWNPLSRISVFPQHCFTLHFKYTVVMNKKNASNTPRSIFPVHLKCWSFTWICIAVLFQNQHKPSSVCTMKPIWCCSIPIPSGRSWKKRRVHREALLHERLYNEDSEEEKQREKDEKEAMSVEGSGCKSLYYLEKVVTFKDC